MKRCLAFLLTVLMLLGLTACGGYDGPNIVGSYRNREGFCLRMHENGTWDIGGTTLSGSWEYGSGNEIHIKDNCSREYTVSQYTTIEKPFYIEGMMYDFHKESDDANSDNVQRIDADALLGYWYVIEEGISREYYPSDDEIYFDEGAFYSNGSEGTIYAVQDNQLTITSTKSFWEEDKKFAAGYTYEISLVNGVLTLKYADHAPLRFVNTKEFDQAQYESYYDIGIK